MTKQQDAKLTRMIKILESAERKSSLPAEDLLKLLPIKKTDTILDVGVGTGFLAIPAVITITSQLLNSSSFKQA